MLDISDESESIRVIKLARPPVNALNGELRASSLRPSKEPATPPQS